MWRGQTHVTIRDSNAIKYIALLATQLYKVSTERKTAAIHKKQSNVVEVTSLMIK